MKKTIATFVALVLLFAADEVFTHVITGARIYQLQRAVLHWRYMHQALFFFGVPVLALVVLRRNASDYALSWNRHVLVSVLAILGLSVVLPIIVDLAAGELQPVRKSTGYLVSTLIFQTIFSGCGEELCFRGMFQGEINRVMGRPLRVGRTYFGPGLFVGALFFALGHLGISEGLRGGPLDLTAFAVTGLIGLFLGFAREFVGCIFIVGFLHASLDTYSYLVRPSIPGRIVHFLGIGVVCYLLFTRRLRTGKRPGEPARSADRQDAAADA